jgi:formylglycine-generating enzyme
VLSEKFLSRRVKIFALVAFLVFSIILVLLGRSILKRSTISINRPVTSVKVKTFQDHYGVDTNGILTPEMVEIPGGTFAMGSDPGIGSPTERPQHQVKLNKYLISRFEITNGQFIAYCNATNRPFNSNPNWSERYPQEFLDHPVTSVTWNGATAYCRWLSSLLGKEVRLPTEAEWEYAAQGSLPGTTYEMAENEVVPTTKVGSHQQNPFGLYDMLGNVAEWCQDWYSQDYYQNSPVENPSGPESGQFRVIRGGSWAIKSDNCRITARNYGVPDTESARTSPTIGFRVVVRAD